MKRYIILFISIIIDGLISNFTLYNFNNITYFTPLCTVVCLVIIYDDKSFFKMLFLSSTLYGGLYMNNILLSYVLFYIVMVIIKCFKNVFKDNLFTVLFQIILVIFAYELVLFIVISLLSLDDLSMNDYIYKVTHSLIWNLMYGISIFYVYDKKVLN